MPKHFRWLAILFATLLVVVGIAAVSSQKAHAASPTTAVVQSAEVLQATPAVNITQAKPKGFSGSIVKPFYLWLPSSYCYWSGITSRSYYCYRYSCTYFERVAWGCYDGYVRMTTYYYA